MLYDNVRVFPDREALSRAAAEHLAEVVEAAVAATGRCALALAGGSTPRRLYARLAEAYRDLLPWDRLYLFWGDERYVPHDHAASNYRMAYDALVRRVPLPPGHVVPIPTDEASPEAAADAYDAALRRFFGTSASTFDLTLLGLGEDGHTASLFPENDPAAPAHDASPRWVEAVVAPPRYEIRPRITLTVPALNASRRVFFLVAGAEKRAALHTVLQDPAAALPAAQVRAQEELVWFVDNAAYGNR